MSLLSVSEAQRRLLDGVTPLPPEQLPLLDCLGRWLAEPVVALRDQPWADLSAMDGYALRHADLPGPWRLVGESRAGGPVPTVSIGPGEALRIFTGAPLPAGADTVLVQEEAAIDDATLSLAGDGPDHKGRNVRPRAQDFGVGSTVLEAGLHIGPAQIALAAMAGHAQLAVHRAPRIAILSTGDELVPVGQDAGPGQLPASNAPMLAALLRHWGAEVTDIGLVPDRRDALINALGVAARSHDVILTTGGASVGDHDLVGPAFKDAGGTLDFWKVAMRPGKPLMAGQLGAARFLGLPGNPVSAFVTAILFGQPIVRRLMGAVAPLPEKRLVITDLPLPEVGSRAEYLRARMEGGRIVDLLGRDSAALFPLAHANVLIERPANVASTPAGSLVPVIPLPFSGNA